MKSFPVTSCNIHRVSRSDRSHLLSNPTGPGFGRTLAIGDQSGSISSQTDSSGLAATPDPPDLGSSGFDYPQDRSDVRSDANTGTTPTETAPLNVTAMRIRSPNDPNYLNLRILPLLSVLTRPQSLHSRHACPLSLVVPVSFQPNVSHGK